MELRKLVGSRLLVLPGAQALVLHDDRLLLVHSVDFDQWQLPAGVCEAGETFRDTAWRELEEESGIRVPIESLEPFGCLSDPTIHTLRYPNGDEVQAYAMLFFTRSWKGVTKPQEGETSAVGWHPINNLPNQLYEPTRVAIELFRAYLRTGRFQAR